MHSRSLAVIAVALSALATSLPHAQSLHSRIVGRVITAKLPPDGATVVLVSDEETRTTRTDSSGRYAFDRLQPGVSYDIETELPGGPITEQVRIKLKASETRALDLALPSNCTGIVCGVQESPEDALFTIDLVARVRVVTDSRRRVWQTMLSDDTSPERRDLGMMCESSQDFTAALIDIVRTTRPDAREGTMVRVISESSAHAGAEVLALLSYNARRDRYYEHSMIGVKEGRLVDDYQALGLEEGMSAREAAQSLRDRIAENSRYRSYDNFTPTQPLEGLHYKTGWILLHPKPEEYPEYDGKGEPEREHQFEFVSNGTTRMPMRQPRPGDRVRFSRDQSIVIARYGARGEELRLQPPPRDVSVVDYTDAKAEADRIYRVADIRLVSEGGYDSGMLWIRIVPDR